MITNDAVLFGVLAVMLGGIFYTASLKTPFWKKFYTFIPMILMCYFLPSLLNNFDLVDPEKSKLYFVASRYLLPACLVYLTLSVDFKRIYALGPKANPTGPKEGTARLTRGGGWTDTAPWCRSAIRYCQPPTIRRDYLGFRVAISFP